VPVRKAANATNRRSDSAGAHAPCLNSRFASGVRPARCFKGLACAGVGPNSSPHRIPAQAARVSLNGGIDVRGSVNFAPSLFAFTIGMMNIKPLSRIVLGLYRRHSPRTRLRELTRLLVKADITRRRLHDGRRLRRFITPLTLQALSGRPVLT
jgi:hypothetical protein